MTRGDLKALVAGWLDDLAFGYFTESQVETWINNAQKECQKRLIKAGQNYYTKMAQTSLVMNQLEYVLPDDFKKVNRLEIILSGTAPNENKQPILPITINQQDLIQAGPGTPRFYVLRKDRIRIFPSADSPLILRLWYTYEVTDLTHDTDIPDAPEQYHEFIALLAAEDGFLKDQRVPELIEKKIGMHQKALDEDSQERNVDVPRSIVETGNDSGSGFYF